MWLLVSSIASTQSWTDAGWGLEVAEWTTGTPNTIQALRIDLCQPGLRMRATKSGERGQKTWASATGVSAATNGGFHVSGYAPDQGRAMGDGSEWPDSTDTTVRG